MVKQGVAADLAACVEDSLNFIRALINNSAYKALTLGLALAFFLHESWLSKSVVSLCLHRKNKKVSLGGRAFIRPYPRVGFKGVAGSP